tara:strand:+ start:1139 stop:1330 length:192 start_codon:yes stop_codon:yes gene_type:complete
MLFRHLSKVYKRSEKHRKKSKNPDKKAGCDGVLSNKPRTKEITRATMKITCFTKVKDKRTASQ